MTVWRALWQRWEQWWSSRSQADQFVLFGLSVATIVGAAFRLYNIRHSLLFLADQGRDAIIAADILRGHVSLVGPATSVGSMFLGPLYYYFMAPWLWLARMDPLGPALAVALMGIVTIPLLYYVGRLYVGRTTAFLAALFYASAPYAVEYSRFSWNPNPAPLVMLVLLWFVYKAWNGKAWWWVAVATTWAVIIQLHYVALLAAVPAGVVWLADMWRSGRQRQPARRKALFFAALISIGIVLASFSPLVVFDIRYHGIIRNGFSDFFQRSGQIGTAKSGITSVVYFFREFQGRSLQVLFELWGKEWSPGNMRFRNFNLMLLAVYGITFLSALWMSRRSQKTWGLRVLLITLVGTVAGIALYKSTVFFHYVAFFWPISYILTSVVLVTWWRMGKWLLVPPAGALLFYVGWMSVQPQQTGFWRSIGWTVDDYARISKVILSEVPKDASYSLAHLSEVRDYRGLSYRYFLLQSSHPPVEFEAGANAQYLVIVAENPVEPSDVLFSPAHEIAIYPKGEYRTIQIPNGPRLYFIHRAR